jgi:hypothetical protein
LLLLFAFLLFKISQQFVVFIRGSGQTDRIKKFVQFICSLRQRLLMEKFLQFFWHYPKQHERCSIPKKHIFKEEFVLKKLTLLSLTVLVLK